MCARSPCSSQLTSDGAPPHVIDVRAVRFLASRLGGTAEILPQANDSSLLHLHTRDRKESPGLLHRGQIFWESRMSLRRFRLGCQAAPNQLLRRFMTCMRRWRRDSGRSHVLEQLAAILASVCVLKYLYTTLAWSYVSHTFLGWETSLAGGKDA